MHGTILRTVFQKSFKSNYAPSTLAAKPFLLTGTGFLFFACVFFSFWFNIIFFLNCLPAIFFLVMWTGTAALQEWVPGQNL